MSRALHLFKLTFILCMLSASQAQALEQGELDNWRSLWDSQALSDYGFRFQRSCHCFGEYIREVIVRVENDVVVSATDTETHLAFDPSMFPSVIDMFDQLQSSIDYPAAFMLTEFDQTLGYPTKISVDLDERIADEEIHMDAADLSTDLILPGCELETDRTCAAPVIDAFATPSWNASFLDFNEDFSVDSADRDYLITNILNTTYGDSNLDGYFNTSDLVAVFQANEFEDRLVGNSGWSTGDWNGDMDFTSTDLVTAFQTGSYERTAIGEAQVVPEPSAILSSLMGLLCFFLLRVKPSVNRS